MAALVIRNLPEQLVDLVRDRILNGTVAVDRPIRQDALAAELGVSKIPLREALTRLEQEGLVRSQVNRGYFVRALDANEAEEVYALRLKIEPDATALAAERATEAEREHAIETHAALGRATSAHGESVGTLNRAFHLALIQPSGQALTIQLLERLHVLSERYVRKHLEALDRNERAIAEHDALLRAWLARDGKGVARSVQAHIRQTLVDLRRQLAAVDGTTQP